METGPEYTGFTDDALAATVGQLHALECATRAQLLAVVAELDRREAWRADGATSMAAWLALRLGWEMHSAVACVETARRVARLPRIAAAHGEGRLSWDQLRPVSRAAQPDDEEMWLRVASHRSPRQLQLAARRVEIEREDPADVESRRSFSIRPNVRAGGSGFWGFAPADAAEKLLRVLDALVGRAERDNASNPDDSLAAKRFDALMELAGYSNDPTARDAAEIVIHTDEHGHGECADGTPLHPEVVDLYACEGTVHRCSGDDVVAPQRRPPHAMRRRLYQRDKATCRFPRCGRSRNLHAHHIVFHGRRGPTVMTNLVLLCHYHHRLIHVMGWTIHGDPNRDIRFVRPDGSALPTEPPPLDGAVAEQFTLIGAGARGG